MEKIKSEINLCKLFIQLLWFAILGLTPFVSLSKEYDNIMIQIAFIINIIFAIAIFYLVYKIGKLNEKLDH